MEHGFFHQTYFREISYLGVLLTRVCTIHCGQDGTTIPDALHDDPRTLIASHPDRAL